MQYYPVKIGENRYEMRSKDTHGKFNVSNKIKQMFENGEMCGKK